MTHKFKVGDKGKTRGGDDYEVTAIGREAMLVQCTEYEYELRYSLDGKQLIRSDHCYDLIPPKRRIRGWAAFHKSEKGSELWSQLYEHKGNAIRELALGGFKADFCIYIDREEGEGLD